MERTDHYQHTDIPCPWCDGLISVTPKTDATSQWACLTCNSNYATRHLEQSERSDPKYQEFLAANGITN